MKNIKYVTSALLLLAVLAFTGCEDEEEEPVSALQIPESFTVDIPSAISSTRGGAFSGRTSGDGDGLIEGSDIYEALPYFIALGENSALIVEFIFPIAAALEAQNINELVYVSEDDGREKRININRAVTRDGKDYAFELVTTDVASQERALQLIWNVSPVEGIAIISPYQIDRTDGAPEDARYRIDYSENDPNYEATMLVAISGLDAEEEGLDNIRLWAGKNGNVVDVVGNSNHPDFVLFDENFTGGRNYAFVGRGDESTDLGVVNLGLPPSGTTTNDIFTDFSVKQVLEDEINAVAPGFFTQAELDEILVEANSPAYFNASGFITSGEDNQPASFNDDFVNLSGLSPFIPNEVRTLDVSFIN